MQDQGTSTGTVVYHVPEQRRRRGGFPGEYLAPGESVQYYQKLLSIPNQTRMFVNVLLDKEFIAQVKIGLPCRVPVDALPGKRLKGFVKYVAHVAAPPDGWSPESRMFRTTRAYLSRSDTQSSLATTNSQGRPRTHEPNSQ